MSDLPGSREASWLHSPVGYTLGIRNGGAYTSSMSCQHVDVASSRAAPRIRRSRVLTGIRRAALGLLRIVPMLAVSACGATDAVDPPNSGQMGTLIAGLESPLPEVREAASKQLASHTRLPEELRPVLVSRCRDESAVVRRLVARALPRLPRPPQGAVLALRGLLRDPNEWVAAAAARSLGEFASDAEGAIDDLASVLDRDSLRSSNALVALGRIGAPAARTIPIMMRLFRHEPTHEFVVALGQIGSGLSGVGEFLCELAEDPLADAELRSDALWSIAMIRPRPSRAGEALAVAAAAGVDVPDAAVGLADGN